MNMGKIPLLCSNTQGRFMCNCSMFFFLLPKMCGEKFCAVTTGECCSLKNYFLLLFEGRNINVYTQRNQVIDTRLLELWLTGGGRPELLICHLNCNAIISSTDDQANVTAFKIWHTKPRQNQIIRSIFKTSVHLKKIIFRQISALCNFKTQK